MRFQTGYEPNGLYALNLTTLSAGINGELTWDFLSPYYDYSAYLEFTDWTFGDTLQGTLEVDLPIIPDANDNRFDDFFEVSQPVNAVTTSGEYNLQVFGARTCTATWSRSAGSKDGTCVLRMKLDGYTTTAFTHSFEVIEYTGPLVYTPGTPNVLASLQATQTGNPDNVIQGPCVFVKYPPNPYNEFAISDGIWTNTALQGLSYYGEPAGAYGDFSRDATWPTNYYGWVYMDDGDPNTGEADYIYWNLSIDDSNDADHDTIPDFGDDPQIAPPRQPKLTVALNADHVLLTIAGDMGRVHEIQQLTDLSSTNWQSAGSVTLTNDPQTVSLTLPTGGSSFWRVRAQ